MQEEKNTSIVFRVGAGSPAASHRPISVIIFLQPHSLKVFHSLPNKNKHFLLRVQEQARCRTESTLMSCSWTLAASAGLKCLARTVDSNCHTPLPVLPLLLVVLVLVQLVLTAAPPFLSPVGRTTRFSLASGPMA